MQIHVHLYTGFIHYLPIFFENFKFIIMAHDKKHGYMVKFLLVIFFILPFTLITKLSY